EFTARLPLRNLIWKGGITQTARFVEQLDIALVLDDGGAAADSPIPDEQAAPLLHIYLVESNDADADTYKSVLRPQAKSWVAKVAPRRGEEWLAVYVPSVAEAQRLATASKFLSMRASVFDKLRGDLQTKKDAERVVMLQPDAVESWNALFLAIRERAVQALDDRVASMAEEIRRLDATRMLPGWNYCKFFVFKEGLVNLYRLMGLRDGALAQYDELEAAYLQLFNSQRLSWFSKFGGGEPGDDFTDLLNQTRKPYRRQMVENTISMFDFRIYLFGRQCQLLIDMARYGELVERAQRFIATFAQLMREPGTGLTLAFVSSWVYSTCQNIVEICEGVQITQGPAERAGARASSSATARLLAASKAEFLTSARQQLDVLGTLYRRLPPKYLRRSNTFIQIPSPLLRSPAEGGSGGEDCDDDTRGSGRRQSFGAVVARIQEYADDISTITNPVLSEALASDERFDQIYLRTCDQATQYYLECGRRRFAQILRGDMAQLHICRERWQAAAAILRPLVPMDGALALGVMDVHLLERLAVCEHRLGHAETCLGYVARLIASSQFLDSGSRESYADMLVELAQGLPGPGRSAVPPHGLFAVTGVEAADRANTLCVVATVHSSVAKPVAAATVEAVLLAGGGERQLEVVLGAHDVEIAPGANSISLMTDAVSCPGRYVVRSVRIAIGMVDATIVVSNPNARRHVWLNRHPTNPVLAMRAAPATSIDGPSALRLLVAARGTPIDAGMRIRLFDSRGGPLVDDRCTAEPAGLVSIGADGALVVAEALAADTQTEIALALSRRLATDEVTACAEFEAQGDPRMVAGSDVVEFTPPLAIVAHVESLGDKHVAVVRTQCCGPGPLRLAALDVQIEGESSAETDARWRPLADRGYLRLGEWATVVREICSSASLIRVCVEARYATLADVVAAAIQPLVEELAGKHGLPRHSWYLQRLALAHVRATLDERTTLRNLRIACEPLAPLWEAASADCAPAERAAMRAVLHELSDAV
ncbi:hypothetical protein IWQ57_002227, partial [Coemansia nantahalensis]